MNVLLRLTVFVCGILMAAQLHAMQDDMTRYVKCMMGTGADGRICPMAAVPFGMVQLGPDTYYSGNGYHYSHQHIETFSHTHANGNGGGDLQDICMMPLAASRYQQHERYPELRARFSHDKEEAQPGYYKVKLLDEDITCEMTATKRCGVHRYTYPKGQQYFAVDMKKGNNSRATTLSECFYDSVLVSQLEIVNNRTIRGYRVTEGWAPQQHAYFYARFSKPFSTYRMFDHLES